MTAPDNFPAESYPSFTLGDLSNTYPFQFYQQVETACLELPPEQEGAYRASIIVQSPSTNEDWRTAGMRAGTGEDIYASLVLGTFAGSARDPEITRVMLEQLRVNNEVVRTRIPPDVMQTVAVRTLNTATAHPRAAADIVRWAFESIPDPIQQATTLQRVLYHKSPDQLAKLATIFQELRQTELNQGIAETLKQYQAQLDKQVKKAQLDRERQAQEDEQRHIAEERRRYIADNPLQAFQEAAQAYRLRTLEDIQQADLSQASELLFAASAILSQAENHSLALSDTQRPIADLARAILDRAVALRREGVVFEDPRYIHSIASNLSTHEERSTLEAASVDDFWIEIAKLAEWRDSISPAQISELYEEWRRSFIGRQQVEQATRALIERSIDPNANFTPESIHSADVSISSGSVAYEHIDELIDDMRSYFVPRMDRFVPRIAARDAIENAIGNAATASLLTRINRPNEDSINMDRLEAEIREWVADESNDEYHDSYDSRGGDPYKYYGNLFTGHGISIKRGVSGQLLLHLQGRGYNHNSSWPTDLIDNFAAFVGKDATYEGAVSIQYIGEPPTEIVRSSAQRTRRGETVTEERVVTSLAVGNIFGDLQRQLSLSNETVAGLWEGVTNDLDEMGDDLQIAQSDLTIGIARYHTHLPEDAQRDKFGNLQGTNWAPESQQSGRQRISLPRLGITIASSDRARQADLAQTYHAIGVLSRRRPIRRYPNGYVGGYNTFHINDNETT